MVKYFVAILLALLLVVDLARESKAQYVISNVTTASKIQCEEGKTKCTECFFTLLKYLLYNDENVFQLKKTFLPPTKQSPVFVTVNYKFIPGGESWTWYWAGETSTIYHPVQGFQFFSLLFGNYQWLTSEVTVYLPIECYNGKDEKNTTDYFELLTQRVSY